MGNTIQTVFITGWSTTAAEAHASPKSGQFSRKGESFFEIYVRFGGKTAALSADSCKYDGFRAPHPNIGNQPTTRPAPQQKRRIGCIRRFSVQAFGFAAMSAVRCPGGGSPVFSLRISRPASGVQRPAFGVRHSASGVRRPAPPRPGPATAGGLQPNRGPGRRERQTDSPAPDYSQPIRPNSRSSTSTLRITVRSFSMSASWSISS